MKCNEKGRRAVSNHMFREIFNTEFNLAFKRRHTDTCKTCYVFNAALQNPQLTNGERQKLQQEQREHHALAERVLETFQKDLENAKETNNTIVLTFDSQKALETPKISTNVAFYKRQLWTYNLLRR